MKIESLKHSHHYILLLINVHKLINCNHNNIDRYLPDDEGVGIFSFGLSLCVNITVSIAALKRLRALNFFIVPIASDKLLFATE